MEEISSSEGTCLADGGCEDMEPLHHNLFTEPSQEQIPYIFHVFVALCYISSGLSGVIFNGILLTVHILLRDVLLDGSGLLLANFIMASLGVAMLQAPVSSAASLAGGWFLGDFACTMYGFVGFTFGIGVIFSLSLLILDRHMVISSSPPSLGQSSLLVTVQWLFVLLLTVPPLTEKFGRYALEPANTACTIDYWHGNYANYYSYILSVVVLAFIIPISIMLYLFLKTVKNTQTNGNTKGWDITSLQHHMATTKMVGCLLIAELVCWTPYAILVLWTVVFPPTTLNVYYTLIPSIFAKISPFVGAVIIWWCVPRVVSACDFVMSGRKGPRPATLRKNSKVDTIEMDEVRPLEREASQSNKVSI